MSGGVTNSIAYPIIILSSGYFETGLERLCLRAMATARVSGPTRPRNIIGSSTARLAGCRFGVPMAETPTVPMALAHSNSMSAREKRPPSMIERESVPSVSVVRNSATTASPLRTVSAGMRRRQRHKMTLIRLWYLYNS